MDRAGSRIFSRLLYDRQCFRDVSSWMCLWFSTRKHGTKWTFCLRTIFWWMICDSLCGSSLPFFLRRESSNFVKFLKQFHVQSETYIGFGNHLISLLYIQIQGIEDFSVLIFKFNQIINFKKIIKSCSVYFFVWQSFQLFVGGISRTRQ